ncbi:MAG: ferrochelatase [Terracidiphilus sp.]|jgi:ferrochelatase
MGKQAVLLLAHGTPETVKQIPEYLRNVVSGRPVPQAVVEEIQHRYALIGKSPLTEITMAQARLVEAELNGLGEANSASHPGDKNKDVARIHPADEDLSAGTPKMGHPEVPVYVGMRNWKPYIPDVVKQMHADGIDEAAVICMAPQNSRTSVGLYRRAVEAEAGGLRIDFTAGWADHPLLAEAFAERLRPALKKLTAAVGKPVPVLFTAHSVPTRTVEAQAEGASGGPKFWPGEGADPYAEDARRTADLVAARVPEIPRWWFAFQSQGASGGPWLGPSVEETLDRIASEGVTALILQPIGFLCDHVEILFDVDVHFRDYAAKLGIRLERPESLNDSGTLARAVADLSRLGLARLKRRK